MQLITLTDSTANSSVTIAPDRGAIVTSFSVSERELLYMEQATLADRSKNVRGGIPILFPIAGKLANDSWQYGNHRGAMPQHGFARQLAWQVLTTSESTVSLELHSSEVTMAQYPWPFVAMLTYSLVSTRLHASLRVTNSGTEVLPYALGYHPYFIVADKNKARITTNASRCFNNVTKQQESFSGFDFTAPEVDVHLLDHGSNESTLLLASEKISVTASNDFGVWVIWTLGGKDFICLEPWTSPGNALNSGERLVQVAPGKSHESWMAIEYLPIT
jgi:galactose mutarotase-like enzyme